MMNAGPGSLSVDTTLTEDRAPVDTSDPGGIASEVLAAERYFVTPCIIIGAGQHVARRFEELRNGVEYWLGESFPCSGVRWGLVTSSSQLSREWCQQLLEPLLSAELWIHFLQHHFIDRLPPKNDLAPLRLYVIYDPGHDALDTVLLQAIAETINTVAAGRASVRRAALLLLPSDTASGELPASCYDEIYLTSRVGRGGLSISEDHIYEVARLALHALVASEAGAMAAAFERDTRGAAEIPLMGLGASAITTAIFHMRDYRSARLAQALGRSYTGEIIEDERRAVREAGIAWQQEEHKGWGPTARSVMSRFGWTTSSGEGEIGTARLTAGPLQRAVVELSSDFAAQLARHLQDIDSAAREEFARERARRQTRAMTHVARMVSHPAPSQDNETRESKEIAVEPIEHTSLLSRGLAWLDGFCSAGSQPAVLTPGTTHTPALFAATSAGWAAQARSIVADARQAQEVISRLRKNTLSPGQAFDRSLIAVPLLAQLLAAFIPWPVWVLWLISLTVTIVVAVVALILAHQALLRRERAAEIEREQRVREAVLGIFAYHARQQHQEIAAFFSTIKEELSILRKALLNQAQEHTRTVERVTMLAAERAQLGPFFEYYLYDLKLCDDWVNDALNAAQAKPSQLETGEAKTDQLCEDSAFDQVRRAVADVATGNLLGRTAAVAIDQIAASLSLRESNPRRAAAIELSNYEPPLRGGLRWRWLFSRALPMAGAALQSPEATIVTLGDRSDLAGADGRSSQDWDTTWLEARSRQPHRITFLRLVALPPDYLKRRSG